VIEKWFEDNFGKSQTPARRRRRSHRPEPAPASARLTPENGPVHELSGRGSRRALPAPCNWHVPSDSVLSSRSRPSRTGLAVQDVEGAAAFCNVERLSSTAADRGSFATVGGVGLMRCVGGFAATYAT
jgi:hypothetical protein